MPERRTLVVLGGGGFRVPLVHGALNHDDAPIDELVLHDVDRSRLAAIMRVLTARGGPLRLRATTDLTEALTGADFVFSAIRVDGLPGRVADERVALDAGVLGQETVGAGGIAYALRTLPVADAIARRIALVAPEAWVINFTNPAGIVTEAMATHLGDRVIGICDSPSALIRRVLRACRASAAARPRYAGLNHLGWLTAVPEGDNDLLPALLADDAALGSFEEGRLFGAERLRQLGAIPNEYLHYYYETPELVRRERAAAETRGEFLARRQREVYDRLGDPAADPIEVWTAALRERDATYMSLEGLGERDDAEGGGYEGVALALMRALTNPAPPAPLTTAGDAGNPLILNVRNRGAIGFLDAAAVVEVPCRVSAAGAEPLGPAVIPEHGVALVQRIKAVERAVLQAAASGSRAVAVRAFAAHPLIDSVPLARSLLTNYQTKFPSLSYLT